MVKKYKLSKLRHSVKKTFKKNKTLSSIITSKIEEVWRQIEAGNFRSAKSLTENVIKKMFEEKKPSLNESFKCEFHRQIILIVLEFFKSPYQSFALSLLPDVFDLTSKLFEGETLAKKLIEISESLVKMAESLTSDEIRRHYHLMDYTYKRLTSINQLDFKQKSKFVFTLSKLYTSLCSWAKDDKKELWVLNEAIKDIETLNDSKIKKSCLLGLLYCDKGRVHKILKERSDAKVCFKKGISIMEQAVDWDDEKEKQFEIKKAKKDLKSVQKKSKCRRFKFFCC